jgi:hypothetical protein
MMHTHPTYWLSEDRLAGDHQNPEEAARAVAARGTLPPGVTRGMGRRLG